jgi:hypothetical protein
MFPRRRYMGTIDAPTHPPRWFHLTPDRFVVALLVVECLLWLSERFQWFPFSHHKGWTVLITIASVVVAMLLMLLWFVAALIFRGHYQFSIRSLLLLVIVIAIPCSWLTVKTQQLRPQRETQESLTAIWELGGLAASSSGQPQGPTWLWPLLRDAGPTLRSLVWDGGVIDYVELRGTAVTDAGLEPLNGLPHLRQLRLDGSEVSDAGLEHLKSLTELNYLDLSNTRVTDAGLEHLKGLPHLQVLILKQTRVTDAGAEKLRQTLPDMPDCGIER